MTGRAFTGEFPLSEAMRIVVASVVRTDGVNRREFLPFTACRSPSKICRREREADRELSPRERNGDDKHVSTPNLQLPTTKSRCIQTSWALEFGGWKLTQGFFSNLLGETGEW